MTYTTNETKTTLTVHGAANVAKVLRLLGCQPKPNKSHYVVHAGFEQRVTKSERLGKNRA